MVGQSYTTPLTVQCFNLTPWVLFRTKADTTRKVLYSISPSTHVGSRHIEKVSLVSLRISLLPIFAVSIHNVSMTNAKIAQCYELAKIWSPLVHHTPQITNASTPKLWMALWSPRRVPIVTTFAMLRYSQLLLEDMHTPLENHSLS